MRYIPSKPDVILSFRRSDISVLTHCLECVEDHERACDSDPRCLAGPKLPGTKTRPMCEPKGWIGLRAFGSSLSSFMKRSGLKLGQFVKKLHYFARHMHFYGAVSRGYVFDHVSALNENMSTSLS